MIWGGIIKLTSKEGDLTAIDLPEGSYFINYQAFHPGSNEPRLNNWKSADRVPDTRNTILWVDDLVLQANDTKTLQFHTSSGKGEYHILIRGVSKD